MRKPLAFLLISACVFTGAAGDLFAGAPAPETSSPRATPPDGSAPSACPVCAYAERFGLRMMALHRIPRSRCPPRPPPLLAALPRGRIRMSDLDAVVMQATEDVVDHVADLDAVRVEFRSAGMRLGRTAFPLCDFIERIPIPDDARASLRGLRCRIEWGAFLLDQPQSRAGVWIEDRTPGERALLKRIATEGSELPPWIRRMVRAMALLGAEYDYEALRIAESVLAVHRGEPHAAAVAYAAYVNMDLASRYEEAFDCVELIDSLIAARETAPIRCHLDDTRSGRYRRALATVSRGGCGG